MKRHSLLRGFIPVCSALLAIAAIGCSDAGTTGPAPGPDTARIVTSFTVQAFAGATPLVYDSVMTSESGAQYKVSTLRFYVSRFALIDSVGNAVAATLVDSAGAPLKYGLTFCDFANPETRTIHVLARKGSYRGVAFSIGVPDTTDGVALNHADASQHTYPLNIDNDMYWGWNPGYVFFKIEGSAMVDGSWTSLVYHIGGDTHLMTPALSTPFTVTSAGAPHVLALNTNKLFVTPSGTNSPNITGSLVERVVHGGAFADTMAINVARSGFIALKP